MYEFFFFSERPLGFNDITKAHEETTESWRTKSMAREAYVCRVSGVLLILLYCQMKWKENLTEPDQNEAARKRRRSESFCWRNGRATQSYTEYSVPLIYAFVIELMKAALIVIETAWAAAHKHPIQLATFLQLNPANISFLFGSNWKRRLWRSGAKMASLMDRDNAGDTICPLNNSTEPQCIWLIFFSNHWNQWKKKILQMNFKRPELRIRQQCQIACNFFFSFKS